MEFIWHTGNQEVYVYYRITTRSLAKREREERLAINASDSFKAFYQYASGRSQHSIGPGDNNKGELVANNRGMAGVLNDFFVSGFKSEIDNTCQQ